MAAPERKLGETAAATQPLARMEQIALRLGAALARYKMPKHFRRSIAGSGVSFTRDEQSIAHEAVLDGYLRNPRQSAGGGARGANEAVR